MIRINKILPLVIVWLTLTSTAPFIFYVWPGHPYKILTFAGLLVMVLYFVFKTKKRLQIDRNILIILIVQIVYYITVTSIYHNYSNINLCIQFIALYIIIVFIDNFIGFDRFVKSYINIILIMGIGGVIIFFIHLLIGITPIFSVKYSASGTTYFLGLTSTNDYINYGGIRIVRFAGFFDEPGAFALFAIFAILLNKIYFNNRKIENFLIVVTLFTLSLAFFIVIVMYLLLFYFKLSYLKYFILPVILVTALLIKLADFNGKNESIIALKSITIDRFKINKKGTILGDNRYEARLHDKKLLLENPVLGVQVENQVKGNNLYSILAKYGLLGSVFYYALLGYLLLLILKLKGSTQIFFLKILLIIVVNFFHRPDFSAVLTLLMLYSMIKGLEQYSLDTQTVRYINY